MMKETSLEARVTKTGEAIGERVQSATVATAAAASQAEKLVQDATASTLAAAGQAKKVLDDAGEAAQQAWSQASVVAEDVVDGASCDQFRLAADRREPDNFCSGRLRTRLRRGLVDSP